jgi:hypothetical protein
VHVPSTLARRLTVGLTAAAVAATVFLLPSSPAAAAPESGLGWSAHWEYYATNGIEAKLTLPGGQLDAFISDSGSTRQALPTLTDTDPKDGLCAYVKIADSTSWLGEHHVCDGDKPAQFFTNAGHGEFWIFLFRAKLVDGVPQPLDPYVPIVIRSTERDPDLRTVGTGMTWSYYTDTDVEIKMHREGVDLTAYAHDSGGSRTVIPTLVSTGKPGECASGLFSGVNGQWWPQLCNPGVDYPKPMTIEGAMNAHACVGSKNPNIFCLDAFIRPPVA